MTENMTQDQGSGGKWIVLQRYDLAAGLLSEGHTSMAHVNSILKSLATVHGLLNDEFDEIYQNECKELEEYDLRLMELASDEDYLANRYDFSYRWFGSISSMLYRKKWDIETKALRRFYKVAGLSSNGRVSRVHVNYLLRSIQTIHDMLGELYDTPYFKMVAELVSDDRKIMAMRDEEQYLEARYNFCQKWLAALSGLLNRKGLVAPPKVVRQNETIGPEDSI